MARLLTESLCQNLRATLEVPGISKYSLDQLNGLFDVLRDSNVSKIHFSSSTPMLGRPVCQKSVLERSGFMDQLGKRLYSWAGTCKTAMRFELAGVRCDATYTSEIAIGYVRMMNLSRHCRLISLATYPNQPQSGHHTLSCTIGRACSTRQHGH